MPPPLPPPSPICKNTSPWPPEHPALPHASPQDSRRPHSRRPQLSAEKGHGRCVFGGFGRFSESVNSFLIRDKSRGRRLSALEGPLSALKRGGREGEGGSGGRRIVRGTFRKRRKKKKERRIERKAKERMGLWDFLVYYSHCYSDVLCLICCVFACLII